MVHALLIHTTLTLALTDILWATSSLFQHDIKTDVKMCKY